MKRKLLLAALCVVGALGFKAQAQDAGTYYIQNVGTGKWLGPGNNWGTQASVLNHADYWKLAKISDGVYTLESVVSNGGTNYYLTGSYCDGGATNFTFTAITGKENTYSIANASGGYLTTNGTTVDVSATDASAEVAQWKLWSEDDMTAGMAAATKDNPFDATYLIKDHDLGRNNRDYSAWSNTGATAPKTSDKNVSGASRYSIEAYCKGFDVNQTLSSVPKGVYAVRVNGFYRQDGNDANLPYVYANDSKTTLPARTGTENNMQAAAVSFEAGNYLSDPAYVQVTDGTLKIGVATTGTSCWSIFKNFHLAYYGDVTLAEVLLAEYVNAYKTALAAAQAYQSADMFDEDKTALNTAIDENTIDLSGSVTEGQLTTAAANLNAAAAAAAKATAQYTTYNNIATAVNGNTNVDITSYIANLGFEEGTLTAWTSDNGGGVANNNNYSGKVGTYFVERWQNGVALGTGSLTHDAIVLPAGVYTIKANAQNIEQYNNGAAGTGYFLCVDDEKTEIGAAGVYEVAVKYTGEKNTSTIKFLLDNCTGNWISCDNIVVTYVGEDYPALTAVGGPMNATVRQAQTAALDTYNANKTGENYKAAVEAIAAAQASVNAYAHLKAAVEKITAVATSVQTNGGTITSEQQTALAALYLAYNTGTIADADVLSKVAEGYNLVAPIVKTQTAASADFTLAIRNQSFEYGDLTGWTPGAYSDDTGVRETSNEIYATTGSDAYYLFNTWWQGVPLTQEVKDLPNGQYTLTVTVASDNGATIYLLANGEHNDGTKTTDKTVGIDAEITFLVKDGTATIGVVGGADDGSYLEAGHWWYKADNFRLVKNRDLTEEEKAVVPTAIALYNGETEVTEPIALDATNNTVTLTPAYTPNNATEGVEWTSSDESVATVANGVVTGVAPGTATITATSTLDADVSATATVTVTYPESTVPAITTVNDGAKRIVTTISGVNLFKNGTFGYPNALAGWKTIGYTTDAVEGNATVATEGGAVDNGAYITTAGGGVNSEKTLRKAVAVEVGKTYYFSVYTSGKAPGANNFQYNALFKMSDATTENGVLKQFEWPQGADQTTTEWSKTEYVFTAETPYVGVRMGWNSDSKFDEFVLAEVISTEEVGNVDYATAAIPTANVGTGAFQYSQDAINAANALVQGEATVAEVEAAYEAVTTLNAPEATQAYNLVFNCEGHNYTGNALTLIPNPAQTQGLYGLKYLAPANINLAQAFYFVHTTGNKYKVFAVDTDGKDRYITTQAEGYGTTWYDGIRTIDDESKAMEIEIRPNGEGLYILWNTGANKPLGHNGNNNNDLFTNNTANFQFVETSKPSITINTTVAGYGTIMLPFAKPLPNNGVKVYTCAAVDEKVLTLTEVDAIEANKPYIIEGAWEDVLTGDAQGTALTYTDGLLTGVYAETEAPVGSYVLQNQDDKVAFYLVEEDKDDAGTPAGKSNLFVPANRAYLTVSAGANVRALFFPEAGDATGIAGLDVLTSGSYDAIYTANGVKVSSLQKGLNIVKKGNKSYKIFVK